MTEAEFLDACDRLGEVLAEAGFRNAHVASSWNGAEYFASAQVSEIDPDEVPRLIALIRAGLLHQQAMRDTHDFLTRAAEQGDPAAQRYLAAQGDCPPMFYGSES